MLLVKNSLLSEAKKTIESAIKEELDLMGKDGLFTAIEYALLNGGKRFRPIIVLLIAQSLNNNLDVTKAAIACEFFHTASLIADDLPCMDDENTRRCKPALHIEFDEATAILASYSLISSGYEMIVRNSNELKPILGESFCDKLCSIAIETVSKYAGSQGAIGGQYLDLFTKDFSLKTINEIILKKTISLFEIAFVLGWIFGGGDLSLLDLVRKASYHFGMAFQVADDIDDYEEDIEKNKAINIAISLGKEKAKLIFNYSISELKETLIILNLNKKPFKLILDKLEKLA